MYLYGHLINALYDKICDEPTVVYTPILPDDVETYPMYRDNDVLEFAVTDGSSYGYYACSTQTFTPVTGMTGKIIERVEHIETSGTQYITTDVHLHGDDELIAEVYPEDSGMNMCGSYAGSSSSAYNMCCYQSNASSYVRYYNTLNRGLPIARDAWHTYKMDRTHAEVDGVTYNNWETKSFVSPAEFMICQLKGSSSQKWKGKIRRVIVTGKMNFIPVKVGDTFYMFDSKMWKMHTHTGVFSGGEVTGENIEFPTEIYREPPATFMMSNNPNSWDEEENNEE